MCCMSEGFVGRRNAICEKIEVLASSLASVSSNGPTNLDPTKTPTRVPSGQVLELASLVVSIALSGAGSSTLTNIYIC